MSCCLVLLNYNDADTTIELLKSIKGYSTIDKIVVVDNCSTDNSSEELQRFSIKEKKIDFIQTDINAGYAFGNNYGCKYALKKYSPDFLVIANPDIIFKECVLIDILNVYKTRKNVGIVSCIMNCMSEIDLPSAWKLPNYKDCILENLLVLRRLIGNKTLYTKEELNSSPIVKVDVVAGSFFVISSKAYKSASGFDERTFLYYEENILATRLKKVGLKNYILTQVSYDHMHSVSINKSFSSIGRKLDLSQKSRYLYCREYLKCKYMALMIEKITYKIGKFDYVLAHFLKNLFKK